MAKREKIEFKDYKINENDPAVALTMEACEISREEAIQIMRELSYKARFPKSVKKKKQAA